MVKNILNLKSKSQDLNCKDIRPAGFIKITKDKDDKYFVESKNILSIEDKEKIEPKLKEIQSLDEAGIKKSQRKIRRSGENTHSKGGGIGFYEIAKIAQSIEYKFNDINKKRFTFEFKAIFVFSMLKNNTKFETNYSDLAIKSVSS